MHRTYVCMYVYTVKYIVIIIITINNNSNILVDKTFCCFLYYYLHFELFLCARKQLIHIFLRKKKK